MKKIIFEIDAQIKANLDAFLKDVQEIYRFHEVRVTFSEGQNTGILLDIFKTITHPMMQKFLIVMLLQHHSDVVNLQLENGILKLDELNILEITETDFYKAFQFDDDFREVRFHKEKILLLLSILTAQLYDNYEDVFYAFYKGDIKAFRDRLEGIDIHDQDAKLLRVVGCALDLEIIKLDLAPHAYFEASIKRDESIENQLVFVKYLIYKENETVGIPLIETILGNDQLDTDSRYYAMLKYYLSEFYVQDASPQKATPMLKALYESNQTPVYFKIASYYLQAEIYADMLAYEEAKSMYQKILSLYGYLADKHPLGELYVALFEQAYQRYQNIEMRSMESWR